MAARNQKMPVNTYGIHFSPSQSKIEPYQQLQAANRHLSYPNNRHIHVCQLSTMKIFPCFGKQEHNYLNQHLVRHMQLIVRICMHTYIYPPRPMRPGNYKRRSITCISFLFKPLNPCLNIGGKVGQCCPPNFFGRMYLVSKIYFFFVSGYE